MPSLYENLLAESESINDLAYHGTSKEAAEAIQSAGFKISDGKDQFLGTGIYFFDNQRSTAIWWARDKRGYKPWAVIRATVRLGRCFNFQEETHTAALRELITILEREDPGISDATAINALALLTTIDSVVCNWRPRETEPIWPKSRFRKGQLAIVCIRSPVNVKALRLDCTGD